MTLEKTIKELVLDIICWKKEWCTFESVSERIWHNMPQLWISCLRDHYHMLSRWSWLNQFHTSWAMQTCGTWDCGHKKGITALQLLYIKYVHAEALRNLWVYYLMGLRRKWPNIYTHNSFFLTDSYKYFHLHEVHSKNYVPNGNQRTMWPISVHNSC